MARELTARTPLSVLVLERGSSAAARRVRVRDGRDRLVGALADDAEPRRRNDHAPPFVARRRAPVRQYGSFLPGSGVGGAGEHWAGLAWRFSPDEFTLRTTSSSAWAERTDARSGGAGLGRHVRRPRAALLARRADDGRRGQGRKSARQIVPGGNPFERPSAARVSIAATQEVALRHARARRRGANRTTPASVTVGAAERSVSQSRRRVAARLHVLRVL